MSALKIGSHPDIAIMAMYPGQFAKSRKGNPYFRSSKITRSTKYQDCHKEFLVGLREDIINYYNEMSMIIYIFIYEYLVFFFC